MTFKNQINIQDKPFISLKLFLFITFKFIYLKKNLDILTLTILTDFLQSLFRFIILIVSGDFKFNIKLLFYPELSSFFKKIIKNSNLEELDFCVLFN